GPDRTSSVRHGLAALPDRVGRVLVHDAARCLVPGDLVRRVAEAVPTWGAVVPGLPLADTVKQVDAAGTVVATPDRAWLRAVQTPQGFDRDLLERAHRTQQRAGSPSEATDDAALVERLGEPVHVVPGDPRALKITTADDLALAAWLLAAEQAGGSQAGGSQAGGSQAGGSKAGGSKAAGSNAGGSKAAGSQAGGAGPG